MKQSQECFHMIVQIAWQIMGTWPKGSKIRSFVEMLRNLIRNHFCHLPFHARYALLNLSNMSQLDCSLIHRGKLACRTVQFTCSSFQPTRLFS